MISKMLALAAVRCWRYPLLKPLALFLAARHKGYHAHLVDKRAAAEEASETFGWWWLSFVDPDLPDGQRFLGVAVVEGYGAASASIRAHELGVNPGGEVRAVSLVGDAIPAAESRNRLLSKDDLKLAALI